MICELCGIDVPRLRRIEIEGSLLEVCQKCQQYGVTRAVPIPGAATTKTDSDSIEERLEKRERRRKGRDIYSNMTTELVEDYSKKIQKARQKKGLDQKKLAAIINEKKSIIAKLETGAMRPDDRLLRKIEKALGIQLTEQVDASSSTGGSLSGPMTIGDLIMMKMKEKKK